MSGPADGYSVWVFGDLPLATPCGPSYMVESWVRELRRLGLRPRLFTPSGSWCRRSRTSDEVTFRTVRHVGFAGDHHARFSSVAELWRARKELPDVVLVTTPGRVGVLGVTLAAKYHVPLVLVESTEVSGTMAHYGAVRLFASGGVKPLVLLGVAPRLRRAVARWRRPPDSRWPLGLALARRCADALQVQAEQVVLLSPKSLMCQTSLLERPPTAVIPAGIDRLPLSPVPPEVRWRPGALRVLYTGRITPEKGLPLLVDAIRLAVDDGVDAHLIIVGAGHLVCELTEQARRSGVADRVSVIGPFKRSRLRGIYASADVFAFPSVVETQAFVLNEAAHEALPLLVSDPIVNPVVADGESAVVVPAKPHAYAAALRRLQDDPELRARLGAGAQRRARRVPEAGQTALLAQVLRRALDSRELGPSAVRPAALGSAGLGPAALGPAALDRRSLPAGAGAAGETTPDPDTLVLPVAHAGLGQPVEGLRLLTRQRISPPRVR